MTSVRPLEGHLVYFPLSRNLYEIILVEHEQPFYQLGRLQTYNLRLELFEYSNERILTGNTEIDLIANTFSTDALAYQITIEDGVGFTLLEDADFALQEYRLETNQPTANNELFHIQSRDIMDWSESNPFSDITRY